MRMQADALVLRDIHQPPSPSWWPPAPGWWLVGLCALLALAVAGWIAWRRQHRRRQVARLFDDAVARAPSPTARIAAMSELLRRAGRRIDPDADTLLGDDWLRFLERGLKAPEFTSGAGAVLRDGGYRRDASALEADALQCVARERFLDWMAPR